MYLCVDNKYEYCIERLNNLIGKKYTLNDSFIIYGMNNSAKAEIAWLHYNGFRINAVVDRNPEKWGTSFCGEVVMNPDDVMPNLLDDTYIILSSRYNTKSIIHDIIEYNPNYENKIIFLNLYELLEEEKQLPDKSFLDKADLKDIQNENYKMLKWFHNFCINNELRYFLSYGTLLGAVRHNGFIPWDDDVDVSMPFSDYIRFCELIKKQDQYVFESVFCQNDEICLSTIGRLKSNKLLVIEKNFPMIFEDYLSIDIWPMGGYPEDIEDSKLYYEELVKAGDEWKEKVVIPYDTTQFDMEKYEELVAKLYSLYSKYDYDKSKYVGELYCGFLDHLRHDVERRGVDKKNYGITKILFQDTDMVCPIGYDNVLRFKYGNYMEIPVDADKRTHDYSKNVYYISDHYFNRDTKYWNAYYKEAKVPKSHTKFADFCKEYMHIDDKLVDIGCGNGRDSLYFNELGINVVGVDASEIANKLSEQYKEKKNIWFVRDDFIKFLNKSRKYNHIYSRFTIHAIDETQENQLITNAYKSLVMGGYFFIEVRSIHDELYGKGSEIARNAFIYNGHFRRFIVKDELESKLIKEGFEIIYSAESCGFAPIKDSDPLIIRIIAQKTM